MKGGSRRKTDLATEKTAQKLKAIAATGGAAPPKLRPAGSAGSLACRLGCETR